MRGVEFLFHEVEGLYYPFSEEKALISYTVTAQLIMICTNFHICTVIFSHDVIDLMIIEGYLYPPQNVVLGGYTVFSLSVLPSFRHSVHI